MSEFRVRWRFVGDAIVSTSIVVACDPRHAKERIWLTHVGYGELRNKIEFLEIEAVKS